MSSVKTLEAPRPKTAFNWIPMLWIGGLHLGVLLAPFYFSWSGVVVALILYLITGLGMTIGFHRLLTHRSFRTPKIVEYILTMMGSLVNQGGPLQWVAIHRVHHAHSDQEEDPHSPLKSTWWAHFGWMMRRDPELDNPQQRNHYVKDLARDAFHRFAQDYHVFFPIVLGIFLYAGGELWGGEGISWVVWGLFVRTVFVYHATWLVNSAAHVWGYQSHPTTDQSRNLWWVALISFGEGWHNNHHAFQRSARHGLRWWEIDISYYVIRLMALVGLAWDIQLPNHENRAAA